MNEVYVFLSKDIMECFYDTSLLYLWFATGVVAGFTANRLYSAILTALQRQERHLPAQPVLLYERPNTGLVSDVLSDIDSERSTVEDELEDLPPFIDISNDPENPDIADVSGDEVRFCSGDQVVVVLPLNQDRPRFGWGGVSPGDVGVVQGIDEQSAPTDCEGETCYIVDFPNHPRWLALGRELRRV